MKQIIITFLVIVIFSSCSKTEENDHEQIIPKISNNQITYSINDFLEIGFKKTKEVKRINGLFFRMDLTKQYWDKIHN